LVDFRDNKATIFGLSVGLVLFTALGVGLVTYWLLPISFAAAFALGAVVAPPDAVAASAVARRIGLPRRLATVLEGESLVNDATALVSLRTAVAAMTAAGAVSLGGVALEFGWAVVGGALTGLVVATVVSFFRRREDDTVIDTALSFLVPYLAYLPAEELGASGVLAVVVAGLLLGHKSPLIQTASSRMSERINWRTVQFILENSVFLLIGLQMRRIVSDVGRSGLGWGTIVLVCGVVLATAVLLRPLWVFPFRWVTARLASRRDGDVSTAHSAVLSWAGMRGVVTLAAALTLPPETPYRSLLVMVAMVVTVGTLLLHGTTLPWLSRRLGVRGPDPREDALQEASLLQASVAAGLSALEKCEDVEPDMMQLLRERAENRTNIVWERLGQGREDRGESPSETYRRLRMVMLRAERRELLRLRDNGSADHEVLGHVMAQLDVEESMLDRIEERTEALRDDPLLPPERPEDECEHLAAHHDRYVAPNTPHGCPDCLREGLQWVHLRLCLDCGNVGCCDSSPGRHAEKHWHTSGHPVMRSFEPGEEWRWCFVDEQLG
jgi:CPA1 family monovalent cation:H+ antiporter